MKVYEFEKSIADMIREAVITAFGMELEKPTLLFPPEKVDAEFCVSCFSYAKELRLPPAQVALKLRQSITPLPWIQSIEATGPYLNIKIQPITLIQTVLAEAIREGVHYGHMPQTDGPATLIEYSSPNTNKPLHLGHVRNNVLGMALINMMKACGKPVISACILNDRGIHICKAMVAYKHFGNGETPKSAGMKSDHFVGKMYVLFDRASKEDESLMEEARAMLRDWESGNPEVLDLWSRMNRWVYDGFDGTYARIGSRFDMMQYESQTYQSGKKIVQTGLDQSVFFAKEDGSVWIDLTSAGLDEKALLRKDGTSMYVTQDLGVAVERFETRNIDQSIYVVGSEQIYHFKALFEILKRLGYEWADRCHHLSYGMVYLPEGKMKSREGTVVDADDLMDHMKSAALQTMDHSRIAMEDTDRETIAEAVGIGAIKYYILKFNTQKDIHFDPEKSLSFEGTTGAYLQYTYARIQSLIRNADFARAGEIDAGLLTEPEAVSVVQMLLRFSNILQSATQDLNPSRFALYLWELAKEFNIFYTQYPIVKAKSQALAEARLMLSEAVGHAIHSGLTILGIQVVDRM